MIRLHRTHPAPVKLSEGSVKNAQAIAVWLVEKAAGRGSLFSAVIDQTIYGHESVKRSLIKIQNDKCAFCEAKITHIASGDIEHFRPKNGWCQAAEPMNKPGYFWLAYEWSNLLFVCEKCNRRHKKNQFPLSNPAGRASPDKPNAVEHEKPIFINPFEEEPEGHIEFNQHVPRAKNGSVRGKATIDGLGLDRKELNDHRREKLKLIEAVKLLLSVCPPEGPHYAEAQEIIQSAFNADCEYSAMVKYFISTS